MPEPCVISMGSCELRPLLGLYSVWGVDQVIPVDVYVPAAHLAQRFWGHRLQKKIQGKTFAKWNQRDLQPA